MKKDFKLSGNINSDPSKETSLHYYKALWINNTLQENYWNTENIDDGIITMEELKEALKKMANRMAKIT